MAILIKLNIAMTDLNRIPPNLATLDSAHIDRQKPPVILVDGSYYLFRCFHGLPPLSNQAGLPTNAVRGVLNALNKLIKKYNPTHMAVAFDTKSPTFRHELSALYKANRPPMDEDLAVQIPYVHQLIQTLGVPLITFEGFEADDIIGTLARTAHLGGYPVVISTGDKDMAQLVNDTVILEDSFKDSITDKDAVLAKFGVHTTQIADYLTLMGDSVDGIAGIPKIGAKTASRLLSEYGNITEIINNAKHIKGVVGKNLITHQDEIPLNRTLATIVTDLELPIAFDELRLDNSTDKQKQRAAALHALYSELEFRKEIAETAKLLDGEIPMPSPKADKPQAKDTPAVKPLAIEPVHYHTVSTPDALAKLVDELSQVSQFAIDTETTALDWQRAELVGISISFAPYTAYYIPVGHTEDFGLLVENQLPINDVLTALRPLLTSPTIAKIGQHIKYDAHIFAKYGITLQGTLTDTMLQSYVINASVVRHNMDDLAKHYLGIDTTTFEEVAGKGAKQISFDKVAIDKASQYACEDADITYRLFMVFDDYLKQDPTAKMLLQQLEMPTARILTNMEEAGVLIDQELLKQLSTRFDGEIDALEKQAIEIAGTPFKVSSPKQLGEMLFDTLGLSGGKKTKTGQYATSEEALSKIDHPLASTVLEYRGLAKLKSTYTDALIKACDTAGRVHTSYHQALTSTGRLSSSDPNLQNIPIRTDTGRLIREAFIAPQGRVILAADYSQIELRLMAHFSQDPTLIKAFNDGKDIHTATAAELLGKDISEVTAMERRSAKAVNFGLLYGMSMFGLARQLGVETDVAKDYIKRYFARYGAIGDYMQNTKHDASEYGYVKTLLGRKLYTPNIRAKNHAVREGAERAAINAPLQGSAADIIKLAMIAVDKVLPHDKARLLMQVHDELVFEVDENHAQKIGTLIKHAMQNVLNDTAKAMGFDVTFAVPLVVDVGIGANWEKAH